MNPLYMYMGAQSFSMVIKKIHQIFYKKINLKNVLIFFSSSYR